MPRRLDTRAADFETQFVSLLATRNQSLDKVVQPVRAILDDVRARGDAALVELTERFDLVKLTPDMLPVGEEEITAAEARCSNAAREALEVAASRIEAYHRRQLPRDEWFTDETGASLGWRWSPLDSVGVYVPGGTARYPSSVLMNAIPARLAGVARIVMATPAAAGGIDALTLAAAKRAGVSEIYRIGGAQAIAALAYGTQTIASVDKIVGPGNAYVAAAKREVFGHVGIDSIAGPSEILVIADASANAAWVAADLLSQAEHDVLSQCVLITDDETLAQAVDACVTRALKDLPRRDIAAASWRDFGAIVTVESLDQATKLADRLAPEHLELVVENPERVAGKITHAGAMFLGANTPEAIGDYIAGPNHVLPTGRSARFSSGLSALDFMKRTTLLSCPPSSLALLGPHAVALAEAEGLEAHARSIAIRLGRQTHD